MKSPPDAVYRHLRDVDPDTLDADELTEYTAAVAELKAWCDARQVRASRRQRRLAEEGRATDPRDTLSRHGKQSGREAKAAADRETVCTAMPAFEDALADGSVSSSHLDAVASATGRLDDAQRAEFAAEATTLLGAATSSSVDAFGRTCRDLANKIRHRRDSRSDADELEAQRAASKISRWKDAETGMCKTLIELDPVSDREFWTAVQHSLGQLRSRTTNRQVSWDRLTVDALLHAVGSGCECGRRREPSVRVHIDLDHLTDEATDAGLCETDDGTPLPAETVRRLACEGDIIPIVLDGAGVVVDEGRAKRLATAEQRAAIEAMQRTCAHPDCQVTIDHCRIHHLTPWSKGGRTDLDDLVGVCEVHHHTVHEGGWTLSVTPDRIATWTRPDGAVRPNPRAINDRTRELVDA